MLKTAGKLSPESKPRMINLLFQAFYVYSRFAYTIFPQRKVTPSSRAQVGNVPLSGKTVFLTILLKKKQT